MKSLLLVAMCILAVASAVGAQPESVTKYEASIGRLKALGHPSPVYSATCAGSGELVAFGCMDICAMVDGYEGKGYQFPTKDMIGSKSYRYVHPEWGLPLYFATQESMNECVPMLKAKKVVVAYGGWCTAGVEDLDVHFSSPNKSPYRVDRYGDTDVVHITNMAKTEVASAPELQEHVANWLDGVGEGEAFDVRGLYVPVTLADYAGYQPPKEGIHWHGVLTKPSLEILDKTGSGYRFYIERER